MYTLSDMARRHKRRLTPREKLGDVFTRSEALLAGLTRYALYALRDSGDLVVLGRGLFRWADAEQTDLDLLEIAERVPGATLCLQTALARHLLTDDIPAAIDIAVPRGSHRPRLNAPIQLHTFDARSFGVGRETIDVGGRIQLGIYSQERSLVDAVRLGHSNGSETAWEALRRWLRKPGATPAKLLAIAKHFNNTEAKIRSALEILQ